MKKVLLILLLILITSSCSNDLKNIEEQELKCKLKFNPKDIKSILKETDSVLLTDNLEYFETKLYKNSDIPKTIYVIKDTKIIKGKRKYILLLMDGGIVIKLQLYNHFLNNKDALDKVEKPSKEDEYKKVKRYPNNYLKLKENTKYLIFAKSNNRARAYCANGYIVLEYDKNDKKYHNEFSGLSISLEELNKMIK